jgi:dolichol-phosphate mannosyltransferase
MPKTLIFIPTYNERDNAPRMCAEIHALGLEADVLFVDDASPDGTGQLLEELKPKYPRLRVHHRSGKLGIGSAHQAAIAWAYEQRYERLVTMDCDFTHAPTDIPALIAAADRADVVVGSRWLQRDSLPGWNLFRRLMTKGGHFLTHNVLGVPQDASGAFRCYHLDRIPRALFPLAKSPGYAFFYESLFVLNRNGFNIAEVPIVLPARTYGHSKMSTPAAVKSALHIFCLWFANLRRPEQFLVARLTPEIDPKLVDPQGWDDYWSGQTSGLYDLIAGIYRRLIIKRNLNHAIRRVFKPGATLLHAGCGGGQVDQDLQHSMRLTGLDISPGALHLYSRNNPRAAGVKHGSIFDLPFPEASFDGIYNLGVMEHFTPAENARIFKQFHRILKPGGKVVMFWPHARATSVFVLKVVHFFLHRFTKAKKQLHPPEVCHMRSRQYAQELLAGSGLQLADYRFGLRDCFVQAVVVAEKPAAPIPAP